MRRLDPFLPVRRINLYCPPGTDIQPPAVDPTARKYERMYNSLPVDHGKPQVAITRSLV
jgi:hypothetical protein